MLPRYHATYDIWYMIYDIWYMIYDILYMIYDIWYMIYDIWYLIFDIFQVLSGLAKVMKECWHEDSNVRLPALRYFVQVVFLFVFLSIFLKVFACAVRNICVPTFNLNFSGSRNLFLRLLPMIQSLGCPWTTKVDLDFNFVKRLKILKVTFLSLAECS